MDSFSTFLYQSGISIAIFYLCYRMLLHRETWFTLNRILLGASLLLAMMIPFIRITLHSTPDPGTVIYTIDHLLVNGVIVRPDTLVESTGIHLTTGRILQYVYLLGVFFFGLKFLIQISQVLLLIRKYGITSFQGYRIVPITEDIAPFTFFNIIFINTAHLSDHELKNILLHEWEHVRRLHTLDIILLEVVCIIQWFNPFVWLFKYALHELHEYEADQAVIRQGESRLNYQKLILNQAFGHQFFQLAHNLINHSFIKKRIAMITKEKSTNMTILKSLLLLPVAAVLVISFSFTREPENLNDIRQLLVKEHPSAKMDNNSIVPVKLNESTPAMQEDTTIYFRPDTLPMFEGKDVEHFRAWITNHIHYPDEAKTKNISGRVFVRFVVEKDGSVSNVEILQGVDPLLDAEAMRVVKSSPDWTPGYEQGKPVRVAFSFPITFGKGAPADHPTQEDIVPITRQRVDTEGEVFFIVEEMPKFQGGDVNTFRSWIAENLKYPEEAAEKEIGGKVFVRFIVERDGSVDNVEIIRSTHPLLDAEALRVVRSSPKWTPGRQRGKTVRVAYTFPITFGEEEIADHPAREDMVPITRQRVDTEDEVFFIVEEMPKFQGGDVNTFRSWVADHLQYPKEAAEKDIGGKVFVRFIVERDGSVDNVEIIRSANPLLDAEALQVVRSSPKWTPGRQRGKTVRVAYTFPIVFLTGKENQSAGPQQNNEKIPEESRQQNETYNDGELFFIVEEMPRFQGGSYQEFNNYIARNIKYPKSAAMRGISGTVLVQWIVEPDGHVTHVKAVNSVDPDLKAEAVSVVRSSPDWTPGKQRGKNVRVQMSMPVVFTLGKETPGHLLQKNQMDQTVLYIINGEIASMEEIMNLNYNDIASVYVLAGDEAVQKFGEEAKNGVIFINTKKLIKGKAPQKPKDPFDKSAGYLYLVNGKPASREKAQKYRDRKNYVFFLREMSDAEAMKIFGKKAENGVVVIEKKK